MRRFLMYGALTLLAVAMLGSNALSAVPRKLSFQARLTDASGALLSDGTYDMTFRLYDDPTAGTVQWTEAHTGPDRAVVSRGVATVALGDVNSLDGIGFDRPLWLSVEIGGAELSPRMELLAAPYAVRAVEADDAGTLGGNAPGNGAGEVPVSNGTLCSSLNADLLDGKNAGSASGDVPVSDGSLCTDLNADMVDGKHLGTAADEIVALDASARLPAVDGSQLTNTGVVPIGAVVPWLKNLPGVPATLPGNFVECDGQVLSDGNSPLNGQTIPDLNGQNVFLRGNSASGSTGGSVSATLAPTQGCATGTDVDAVTDTSVDTVPPYYDVVWIMRVK